MVTGCMPTREFATRPTSRHYGFTCLGLRDPSLDQPAAEQLDPRLDRQPVLERVHLQVLQQDPLQGPVVLLEFRPVQWQVRSHPLVPHQWQARHHLRAEHHPPEQHPPWSRRPPVQQWWGLPFPRPLPIQ